MTEFVFEDPPESPRRNGETFKTRTLAEFAAVLRDNPGKWALYPLPLASKNSANGIAYHIRKGRWSQGAGFEATVRNQTVYVRYVGAPSLERVS